MSKSELIGNRYAVGDKIGEGGMGAVYKGRDTRSGQLVAIKQLKQDVLAHDPSAIERFRREVDALRRLNHPNIVRLLGTARSPSGYYIIMEYVSGGSLDALLRKQPRLPLERTLQIALDLSDALIRAHRLNIIHRDLKPANVLLTEDGSPRLTDFGIARIGDRTRVTQSGNVMGTGLYMSPEACRGYELDMRADVWGFGLLLYEMLTGIHPFKGDHISTIITAILMQPLPDIRQIRPDIPDTVAQLIHHMLEKNRDQRLMSIRQASARIEAILHGTDTAQPAPGAAQPAGDLFNVLLDLAEQWETRAQEAQAEEKRLRLDGQQAAFYRGMAQTYRTTAQDIYELLAGEGEADESQSMAPSVFVEVPREQVERLVARTGMSVSEMYAHQDNIFTVVFPKIPPIPFDDRMGRLRELCRTIVFLENGLLHENQKPYIDFGFTAPPEMG